MCVCVWVVRLLWYSTLYNWSIPVYSRNEASVYEMMLVSLCISRVHVSSVSRICDVTEWLLVSGTGRCVGQVCGGSPGHVHNSVVECTGHTALKLSGDKHEQRGSRATVVRSRRQPRLARRPSLLYTTWYTSIINYFYSPSCGSGEQIQFFIFIDDFDEDKTMKVVSSAPYLVIECCGVK